MDYRLMPDGLDRHTRSAYKTAYRLGGLHSQPKSKWRLRKTLTTPMGIYRPKQKIYLSAAGFQWFADENQFYNDDNSAFLLFGKGDFTAVVIVDTGEVIFMGNHDVERKMLLCTALYVANGIFIDTSVQIFDEVPSEARGDAAEFIAQFEKDADA